MSPEPVTTPSWNVASHLKRQAVEQPAAAAIHVPTGVRNHQVQYRTFTYAELDETSDLYARGLIAYGIKRGDRVALMVTPGIEFFALFFALFKAGIAPVLIDPGIGLKPLKTCLAEAAPTAFIGITKAHIARALFGWARSTITHKVTVGPRLGWGGIGLRKLRTLGRTNSSQGLADVSADEMAAILFTSGSTGIPKGVVYRHRHFVNQVEMLRETFDIKPGEKDLATFPPFALFDPALGMTTVVPHMDPTRPASANPRYLVQAIEQFKITNIFGSPALLKLLGKHTEKNKLELPTVRRFISAGAAVPAESIRRIKKALPESAQVFTPYGATECLPVASLSSRDLDEALEQATRDGHGICVGRAVHPNRLGIITIDDNVISHFNESDFLAAGKTGEIMVHGPTTTDQYWKREAQTRLAKSTDQEGRVWHRMGDVGYIDDTGRVWYCGRKSQRVQTTRGDLFPDQAEAVFNTHADVERTALVGIGKAGKQEPVLCVELIKGTNAGEDEVRAALLAIAAANPAVSQISDIRFHPSFPVDIRHNSKIGREALAEWALENS